MNAVTIAIATESTTRRQGRGRRRLLVTAIHNGHVVGRIARTSITIADIADLECRANLAVAEHLATGEKLLAERAAAIEAYERFSQTLPKTGESTHALEVYDERGIESGDATSHGFC